MREFLGTPLAQTVIWSSAGICMMIVGIYAVRRFRGRTGNAHPTTRDLLTNFRELHDVGELDDEEFRNIKTRLGSKLQDELKDTGETG